VSQPHRSGKVAAAVAALLLASTSPSSAQVWQRDTKDATVPVNQLDRPDYTAPGLVEGAFLLHAGASESAEGDNNIFASPGSRESDFISTTEESFSADSQWSEDALSARLFSKQQEYASHPTETGYTYGAVGSALINVGSFSSITIDGNFLQEPQARNSTEADVHAIERPVFNSYTGTLSFLTRYGRWLDLVQVGAQQIAFISQRDATRSGTRHTVTDQLSYEISDTLSVGIEGATDLQDWLVRPNQRNFHTLSVLAGLRAEEPTLWLGEIGIGLVRQEFSDPGFKTLDTPAIKGRFIWNIDPLTSVVASAARRVSGTETFCDKTTGLCLSGSASSPAGPFAFGTQLNTLETTVADVAVQREAYHDLLCEVGFRYERDVFDFNNLIDDNYAARLTVRYLLNENFELDAGYTYTQRTATLPEDRTYNSGPYKEHVLSVTVEAAL
jgi:hypothetical protein